MELLLLAIFILVKYFGYLTFLKKITPKTTQLNLHYVSGIRLIIGVLAGGIVYALGDNIVIIYLTLILVTRVTIWYFLFRHYYKFWGFKERAKYTIYGTVISYVLDLPASLGFIAFIGSVC